MFLRLNQHLTCKGTKQYKLYKSNESIDSFEIHKAFTHIK